MLKAIKRCSCGLYHDRIPDTAREGRSERDEIPGFYWECSCKSTLFAPIEKVHALEYCGCPDCFESDTPCSFDCDDKVCRGCAGRRAEREEAEFEAKMAMGCV